MPQIQQKVNEHLQENASAAAKSTAVPSFEFFATSEEGINLFVDINSSLLEHSRRLQNQICVCPNLQENKFQSFREELQYLGNNLKQMESSSFWNTISRMSGGDSNFGCSSNSVNKGADDVLHRHLEAESGPSEMSILKPFNAAQEVSNHLEQQRDNLSSSGHNSGVKGLIAFDMNSCPRHEETETVDPKVSDASQEEMAYCSTEILAVNGSETNDQKMVVCNNISKTVSVGKKCNLENGMPSTVSSSISAIKPLSEPEGLQKNGACLPFINDPVVDDMLSANTGVGELVNSVEINYNASMKSSAEKQASGSLIDQTQALDSKLAKSAEKSISHAGRKRKRHGTRSGLYSGRILRSARRHGRQVRLTKSMRLVSK